MRLGNVLGVNAFFDSALLEIRTSVQYPEIYSMPTPQCFAVLLHRCVIGSYNQLSRNHHYSQRYDCQPFHTKVDRVFFHQMIGPDH